MPIILVHGNPESGSAYPGHRAGGQRTPSIYRGLCRNLNPLMNPLTSSTMTGAAYMRLAWY